MFNLSQWFQRTPPSVLGLDLQASGLRLVELSRNVDGAFQIERCFSSPCHPGWLVNGHVQAFDELAQELRALIHQSGAETRDVVLGLPASCVTTRKLRVLAGSSDSQIQAAVDAAVAQWVPGSRKNLIVDHCRIDLDEDDDWEVLVAVSRRDPVQDRVGLAEAAGLNTVAVDLEAQACGLALAAMSQASPRWQALSRLALVEVEAEGAHFQQLHQGELVREASFTFPRSSQPLLASASGPQRVDALVAWVGDQLTAETMPLTLPGVDAVVLAGTACGLPEIARAIELEARVPVCLADPFETTVPGRQMTARPAGAQAAGYLRAFGLAIQGTLQGSLQ